MADWSREDILFSVRRYLSEVLGRPWVLRFERAEIKNEERPIGVIDLGAARTTRSRSSVPQGNVERAASITINLYPGVGADPRSAKREAAKVAQLVQDLVDFGLDLGNGPNGRPRAGPHRIPLYDYRDVVGAGPPDPYDHLWVDPDFNVRDIQDPVDVRRYAVIAEGTVTWEATGRTYGVAEAEGGRIVRRVPGTFVPDRPVAAPVVALAPAHAEAGGALALVA